MKELFLLIEIYTDYKKLDKIEEQKNYIALVNERGLKSVLSDLRKQVDNIPFCAKQIDFCYLSCIDCVFVIQR